MTLFPILLQPRAVQYAWCAGFFDGEGCVSKQGTQPRLTIGQQDRETLDQFQAIMDGKGKLYVPLTPKPNGLPRAHYYKVMRQADVVSVMTAMWPYLGRIKRDRYLELGGLLASS